MLLYDPAPDFPSIGEIGFVYSAPEIARLIDRARRLEEARALFAPSAETAFMYRSNLFLNRIKATGHKIRETAFMYRSNL